MRRSLTLAALLAAVLGAAACGGGGDDEELSPRDYRAEARRICVEANRATEAVEQPTRSSPEAISDYFQRLLAPNERATRRFEQLDPPAELQDAHDDAVRANRRGSDEVRRLIRQLEAGEDPRQALDGADDRIRALTREADAAAERLGVPECGD